MEEALQRNSFPPPSPRPEIIIIFITGRVSSLRFIKCFCPLSPADPDTLFGRTRSTAPRSTTSSVERSSEWRFQEQRAEIESLSKLSSNIVETDTIFVLYQRWYTDKGRSCAPARPFCSHLYSDSIQGSIRASQTTGRMGEVDKLGQDLLLESSTDHRPRTRTRRLPTFNLTAPLAASDGIRR